MTKQYFEILLFATVTMNAALLLFFAGVFRKMMDSVSEAMFKQLIELLFRYSTRSPFMIGVLNIPLLVAIPYYYLYGFNNRWITWGLVAWLLSGCLAKIYKLPVYKAVSKLNGDDLQLLDHQRRKFNTGNIFQAMLYSGAAIMMTFGLH
jgi:hypothetical protein